MQVLSFKIDEMESKESTKPRGAMDEKVLADAIKMTNVAFNLCLSNKFVQAQAKLEPWVNESMYHALGYSTIMYLQAMMTFEPVCIFYILTALTILDSIIRHRRKQTWTQSFTSWIWNPYDNLKEVERHAELCYAECLFMRAMLTFIQDENLVSFIKGALRIRSAYQTYKTCLDMITHQPASLLHSAQRMDFEGGVHLGIGGFNLMLSLLPAKIIKLLEWVGFSGDKLKGLEHLERGCLSKNLRSPMCAMVLLAYHSVITYYLGNGEGDVIYAEEILQPQLKAFPKGAIFLYYAARIKQVQGKLDEAIEKYNDSISSQSEWKQFHHICYWEVIWCYSYSGEWSKAFHYASVLLAGSSWSKVRLELILLWNGFKVLHHRPDLVQPMLNLVQTSLAELETSRGENVNYIDDWCLGTLLQGMCFRCMRKTKEALESMLNAVNMSKDLVQDFYLAPFACAEVGFLYLEEGDLSQAKEYLNRARKDYENHMLQSRLHFRIHSALQEIKHVQKQAKAASKRNNKTQKHSKEDNNNSTSSFGEDSMEDSSDLERKDSSSSFETAPEDSGAEDEGNLGLVDEEGTLNQSALRETAV
ncbi:PREDICTED: tetratricopeptide repeat protein 39B-like [Acropora digitifera]|uniref:tetratricopeptide repeat protein 39B-like n=1 Tax=Acropora digitifera TaxID=70779 RepID=UPI00077A44DF|nr:PREDICTED: tetratricopeptide repeat protein 39B-like [Acropora digitifera]